MSAARMILGCRSSCLARGLRSVPSRGAAAGSLHRGPVGQGASVTRTASHTTRVSGDESMELHRKTLEEYKTAETREEHNTQQAAKFNADVSAFTAELPGEITERLVRIVGSVPGLNEESRIVDVGSGTGCLIPHLRARGVEDILAVDLSSTMLAELNKRYGPSHNKGNDPSVRTWCGDIVDLPPYMGPVDAVLFNACFGNMWDPHAALARASLLLRDGGHVVISHPLGRTWQEGLHELDPAMVPHVIPDKEALTKMVADLPLKVVEYIDEEELVCAVLQVPPRYALDAPLRLEGPVVMGFGRGSKQMGVPTANLEPEPLVAAGSIPEDLPLGVYFGWAQLVDDSVCEADRCVHPMVMNVGTRPTIDDGHSHSTVEAHILHTYEDDFYGSTLRLLPVGFLRPEMRFNGLDALIARIKTDIGIARSQLTTPEWDAYKTDSLFD